MLVVAFLWAAGSVWFSLVGDDLPRAALFMSGAAFFAALSLHPRFQ